MRPPARIEPWLSVEHGQSSVRTARGRFSFPQGALARPADPGWAGGRAVRRPCRRACVGKRSLVMEFAPQRSRSARMGTPGPERTPPGCFCLRRSIKPSDAVLWRADLISRAASAAQLPDASAPNSATQPRLRWEGGLGSRLIGGRGRLTDCIWRRRSRPGPAGFHAKRLRAQVRRPAGPKAVVQRGRAGLRRRQRDPHAARTMTSVSRIETLSSRLNRYQPWRICRTSPSCTM